MLNAVCFGEVLWDVLPSGKIAGGAPMNVAFHLQQLGIPTHMISRLGNDALGKELLDFLQEKKVATTFLQSDEHYPTGVVKVQFSSANEPSYTIEQPAAWDFIEHKENLQHLIQNATVFVHGSLIARNPVSRETLTDLIKTAPFRVFDVNLRMPFYDQHLIETLLPNTNLLKLNEEEAALLSQWFVGDKNWQKGLYHLQEKFNIPVILVTLGKDGAQLFQEGKVISQTGFSVTVQDTIGSGDAFLAGFLSQWMQKIPPAQCLQFACAMGALVATHRGALPTIEQAKVFDLIAA